MAISVQTRALWCGGPFAGNGELAHLSAPYVHDPDPTHQPGRTVSDPGDLGNGPGPASTPLRELAYEASAGCRVLGDPGIAYRDGGEARVLAVLQGATDLSSTSDELLTNVETWPERYHLDPARAHVLRPLELGPGLSVLEIGAGCGAITRILGERCGLVDAVEPMAERAQCGRERTRDLANVEVFVGLLDDVPLVAAYDVVVIMGVLEYVGAGSAEREPYATFLARAAALLRPGGTLILGIENRFGVKYLCGAPEDHSNRPFESVEGYDDTSRARTFGRRELEGLVRESGLSPLTLGLFPDYKLTRLVATDALLDEAPALAAAIPHFPSPDWAGGEARVANEARVWANLIGGGLGGETANSFLVLGHRGTGPAPIWPEGRLAAYYPISGRRMRYALESFVERQSDAIRITRQHLCDEVPEDGIRIRCQSAVLTDGTDLVELMAATTSDEALAALLQLWVTALEGAVGDGDLPLADLLPHNAIVTPDGSVTFIDAKWDVPGYDAAAVMARAAIETASRLAVLAAGSRWPTFTLEDLARHIGAMLNLPAAGGWLDEALDREADFQAAVTVSNPHDHTREEQIRRLRAEWVSRMQKPLASMVSVGPSASAEAARADEAEVRARALEAQLAEALHSADSVRHQLDAVTQSRTFRYSALPRRIYGRLRRT
jgi:SAM-dependent methyltransferase